MFFLDMGQPECRMLKIDLCVLCLLGGELALTSYACLSALMHARARAFPACIDYLIFKQLGYPELWHSRSSIYRSFALREHGFLDMTWFA
jgi:hypothetical protein